MSMSFLGFKSKRAIPVFEDSDSDGPKTTVPAARKSGALRDMTNRLRESSISKSLGLKTSPQKLHVPKTSSSRARHQSLRSETPDASPSKRRLTLGSSGASSTSTTTGSAPSMAPSPQKQKVPAMIPTTDGSPFTTPEPSPAQPPRSLEEETHGTRSKLMMTRPRTQTAPSPRRIALSRATSNSLIVLEAQREAQREALVSLAATVPSSSSSSSTIADSSPSASPSSTTASSVFFSARTMEGMQSPLKVMPKKSTGAPTVKKQMNLDTLKKASPSKSQSQEKLLPVHQDDDSEGSGGESEEEMEEAKGPRPRGLSIEIPKFSVEVNPASPRFFESPTPQDRGIFDYDGGTPGRDLALMEHKTAAMVITPSTLSHGSRFGPGPVLSNPTPGKFRPSKIITPSTKLTSSVVTSGGIVGLGTAITAAQTVDKDDRERLEKEKAAQLDGIYRRDSDGDLPMSGSDSVPASPPGDRSLTIVTELTSPVRDNGPMSPGTLTRLLSPDPKAFNEKEELMKKNKKKKPKTNMPPTPDRIKFKRAPLERGNSLLDDKVLRSFWGGEGSDSARMFEFVDIQQIGEGAFFQVFRVKDRSTGILYAVKKAKRPFRGKQDRQEYLKEVEVAAYLKPHPNVIRYYQAWQEGGHFYLQMEFCNGNLTEHIERLMSQSPSPLTRSRSLSDSLSGKASEKGLCGTSGKITNEFVGNCCRQIAQGLSHIHKANVLHLDIKPDNILVNSEGVLKLADFGHSSLKKEWKDGGEGDSMYMAPELLGGSGLTPSSPRAPRATPKADIFSLGLLLFELVTGAALPSSGPLWHKLRNGAAEELLVEAYHGAIGRILHPGLKKLIVSMLAHHPDARPNADQILGYLSTLKFSSSPPPEGFSPKFPPSTSPSSETVTLSTSTSSETSMFPSGTSSQPSSPTLDFPPSFSSSDLVADLMKSKDTPILGSPSTSMTTIPTVFNFPSPKK